MVYLIILLGAVNYKTLSNIMEYINNTNEYLSKSNLAKNI